jgi:hypothetical protein
VLSDNVTLLFRSLKGPLASGIAWLACTWIIFGNRVIEALGGDCGTYTSADCAGEQSPEVRLLVLTVQALGPLGTLPLLLLIATVVGGTMNFVAAWIVGKRRPKRPWVNMLMNWSSVEEIEQQAKNDTEWTEAMRIRGEGMARLTCVPPTAISLFYLSVVASPYWLLGFLPLILIAIHGMAALRKYSSLYSVMSDRSRGRTASA